MADWLVPVLECEVEALVSIRAGLNDPHGALANWDGDSVDPCSWAMITCSSENLVISLEASGQNFSGRLSGRIGDLKNIQQMYRFLLVLLLVLLNLLLSSSSSSYEIILACWSSPDYFRTTT